MGQETKKIFISEDFNVTLNEEGGIIFADATSGQIDIFLPYAINYDDISVMKIDDSLNAVRIISKGNDSIEGSESNIVSLESEFRFVTLTSDRNNQWYFEISYTSGSVGGGGGGSGSTDHGVLTGLLDNDHPQYVHVSGANKIAVDFDLQGNAVVSASTYNGVDLLVWTGSIDGHILNTSNPHSTDFSKLDPDTLANLNSVISDANVDDSGSARPPTLHSASHLSGGADPTDLLQLQAEGIPDGHIFGSDGNGGVKSFLSNSIDHGQLNGLGGNDHPQYTLTQSFQSFTSSIQEHTASTLESSASFSSASSSFALFSASHAEMHLSGGRDPIDAQNLRGDGLAINRLLITDGSGGWTTVISSAVGGSGGGGGGIDPDVSASVFPREFTFITGFSASSTPADRALLQVADPPYDPVSGSSEWTAAFILVRVTDVFAEDDQCVWSTGNNFNTQGARLIVNDTGFNIDWDDGGSFSTATTTTDIKSREEIQTVIITFDGFTMNAYINGYYANAAAGTNFAGLPYDSDGDLSWSLGATADGLANGLVDYGIHACAIITASTLSQADVREWYRHMKFSGNLCEPPNGAALYTGWTAENYDVANNHWSSSYGSEAIVMTKSGGKAVSTIKLPNPWRFGK